MDDAREPLPPWPDDQFVDYAQSRQHTLLRAAYLVCGDLRIAEGLVRSALVHLARQWDRVREEQPDLFVRRLLYRDAIASWRHRPPQQVATGPGGEPGEADEADEPWDCEEVERRREVLRALDALTPRQRAVVVLRWFEERGEPEIAEVLGCGPGTVHGEGVEALGRLRDALPRADLGTGGLR
jgi:RNA polymerase sigma-70 factor (sigma-E family)